MGHFLPSFCTHSVSIEIYTGIFNKKTKVEIARE